MPFKSKKRKKIYDRIRYKLNKVEISQQAKVRWRKIRKRVLDVYGGRCACCKESRYEFLAIDHIHGGGLKQFRALKKHGAPFCRWLIANKFPKGFRVLCHNCNLSLGFYKYCPHKRANNG